MSTRETIAELIMIRFAVGFALHDSKQKGAACDDVTEALRAISDSIKDVYDRLEENIALDRFY